MKLINISASLSDPVEGGHYRWGGRSHILHHLSMSFKCVYNRFVQQCSHTSHACNELTGLFFLSQQTFSLITVVKGQVELTMALRACTNTRRLKNDAAKLNHSIINLVMYTSEMVMSLPSWSFKAEQCCSTEEGEWECDKQQEKKEKAAKQVSFVHTLQTALARSCSCFKLSG